MNPIANQVTTTTRVPNRPKRRGVAAVEFALVAPLFILLVMGMIEVGRGLIVQQILTNAAREGAREAVMDGATKSEVQTVVTNYLTASTIPGATVAVTPDPPSSAGARQAVTVTVSVSVSDVKWLMTSNYFSDSDQLSSSATMLTEAE